jgi:hypothetical protein
LSVAAARRTVAKLYSFASLPEIYANEINAW